ncbi:DUF1538 domain-containing protein [Arcobacter cloacae]|uniref:Uncharacterized protein n=1 Tax=Arcobacter cloacae TaxID=1054034 RepID=A0A6M8NQS0_9BACT|nr:DUF1538 domain-containing protein [Arcobacter cloacae]QKF90104.1 DUF1538 domain-containing membrane protein [Arcobacter cloacae]RXI39114.1 hypothetical protein CP963_10590 [Arcobacter cloacae]
MNGLVKQFRHTFIESTVNLIPILLIIVGFQLFVFQSMPENVISICIGFFIVIIGVTFFLMGLEIGIFPLGNNLSSEFLERKSIFLFALFGFALGFSASIAEPAIIAVASQAGEISKGALDPLTLRLIIATSVGLITAFGIVRTILGWNIAIIIIVGYVIVLVVTYFTPPAIIGLAYDSGGVATNVATVPLIVALGIGIASALQGRSVLKDGFGFVALAAITPMISIQLYGIFALGSDFGTEAIEFVAKVEDEAHYQEGFTIIKVITDLFKTFLNLVPIIATILIFQYLVIKKPLANISGVIFGFIFLVIGLYGFIVGIKLGLFPIGESIAGSLVQMNNVFFIYLFAFLIGFGTTMAEPALVAVIKQADKMSSIRLNVTIIRLLVAIGVGFGILFGAYKIVNGYNIWLLITILYSIVVVLTIFAPKQIVAFAFDLGGVTTSEITVPIVTAFGIFLATNIEGRNVLMDGFGLIAFASVFPMITVMSYSIIMNLKK